MIPTAEELAKYTLDRQHPLTRAWADDGPRLAVLAEEHAALDILLAEDLEIAAQRATNLAPGKPAETMLNKWVAVSNDLSAMFGIRLENMNPAKPFVDATPMTRSPEPRDLPALAAAAREHFGVHDPLYLRLWSAEPELDGTEPDRRFLAAPISELQPRDVPAGLALRPAKSVDHYDEAREAYDAVDADHPHHADEATLQSLADLQESADDGLLFDVMVNGEWAGYSAAMINQADTLGLPAYVVGEVILAKQHRGHGYGRHLSALLAQSLPDPTRILIGTIHSANHGARTAALRAGRQDIGGWLQLPLNQA
ncbi:GNAT family N-acetyltransferase [Kribbella solani]|uniref:GNAT family N-acetyltransferase n=1 Tax=Kribbella solani TaxID=236067 RepID=UPI0029A3A26B|nr:GNAT family N-acetyltransferase [Kribbella solani]MDX3000941.1 GNAT family N-acetyltransferase [Kribbella solani]